MNQSASQPYDACVTTPNGPVPLGEIVERGLVDLELYDRAGTTRVVAVNAAGMKPVLRCVLKNGNTLEATADHFVLAETGDIGDPRLIWLEAGKLKPGMQLVQRLDTTIRTNAECEPKATSEAILAGWLQGDGYACHGPDPIYGGPTVEFMTADDEEFEYLRPHIARVFGGLPYDVRAIGTDEEGVSLRRLRLRGESLSRFVGKYALSARGLDMRVPRAIMHGGHTLVTAYLRGLFQTDGAIHCTNAPYEGCEIVLACTAEGLVRDAQKLLANLGIYSRISVRRDPSTDRRPKWALNLSGWHEREKFRETIGFVSAVKQERLDQSLLHAPRSTSDGATLKFESITRLEYEGEQPVFEIQTQSGNYLSGNIVVHNSTLTDVAPFKKIYTP